MSIEVPEAIKQEILRGHRGVSMGYDIVDERKEQVNHPRHYNVGKIEVLEAMEDWFLPMHEANVVKYVVRAQHKGTRLQDLQKAMFYLRRKIHILESETEGKEPKRPNEMPCICGRDRHGE